MSKLLNFEDQFTFYAAYHTNKNNVLIHILCVPTILFTALILTHGIPGASRSLASLEVGSTTLDPTFPFLWAAGNAIYFILLEPIAGFLYAPILLSLGHLSNVLYSSHHDAAMKYAGIAFVASWIAQFVGHAKFEGRAPALFDSLLQSLVLAVFFVFLEILFFLGYKPALFKRLQNKTGVEVAKYRREKAAKEGRKAK
ncbi:2-hydroxy-palmitic acid dioxygenase MPO1 [Sporobolomyces salmoneus]|uniref:2-hydroxy-palmitic acid dioxygenase MPO1 n=1 Tax=Sporobolomyces salmoneus TaxID=183962 RepID=UPI003172F91D